LTCAAVFLPCAARATDRGRVVSTLCLV